MPREARPSPRKLPSQARSRALYAAILTASAELLERDGPDFALSNVAARAGVSPGSLYQYFPDRGALIAALIDWQIERDRASLEEWKRGLDGTSGAHLAESLVEGLLRLYGARPALLSHMVRLLEQLGREADVQAVVVDLCAELALQLRVAFPDREGAACREAADAAVHGTLAIVRQVARESPDRLGDASFRARLLAVARAALER
jgi:AcrR family transcriptional regulator